MKRFSSSHPSRFYAVVLILACSIPNYACYTYHVYQVGGPDGREQGNQPGTEWQGKTLHSFVWGGVRQDLPIENCQLANGQRFGMEEVRVSTNFPYLIASVVTLGIWVPLKVSWKCAKPPGIRDTLALQLSVPGDTLAPGRRVFGSRRTRLQRAR